MSLSDLIELDEAKTKLYTNITHEFRTPLTIILGMADTIRTKNGKQYDEEVRKIENNGRILMHLVNQMLDLSKLEAGAMPVNLIQADVILYIRYLVDLLNSLANSKNITLRFSPDPDHLMVDYDPDKMMDIVSNLVSNALKYTPPGGLVEITSALTGNVEQKLEIRVRDNGPGIPKDLLPDIFDRFYRVENNTTQFTRGSGLGLAITKELVKLLNGSISVESVYGEGTEFILTLPVTQRAPVKTETAFADIEGRISAYIVHHHEKSHSGDTMEVVKEDKPLLLIVEDSNDVVSYLSTILEMDYNIMVAVNGKEGLEKALELVPDIILSDVMMPEMDGIELLDRVKNDIRTSHIPVVILTARADISSRLTGLERGADAYMEKPFVREELILQLKKLIELRKKLRERYSAIRLFNKPEEREYHFEDSFMQRVHNTMSAHLNDEFDIKWLCQEVAMSRTQLYRKFKSLTERTVSEYFRSFRLHKAKELLMSSDIRVAEAAYRTGFRNISHFSRVFTKEFGINPCKVNK